MSLASGGQHLAPDTTVLWGGPGPGVWAGEWVGMLAQQGWQGW